MSANNKIEFNGELFKTQIRDRVKILLAREKDANVRIQEQIQKFEKSGNLFKLSLYREKLIESEKKMKNLENMLQ